MNVTWAQITLSLTPSFITRMPETSFDVETARLAAQAKTGDREAFCALIERHQRAARQVAIVALGSVADADEAVQDACLTAWQRLDRLDDPAAFRAWLLRIIWRKALDRRRSIVRWLKRVTTLGEEAGGAAEARHAKVLAATDPLPRADEQLLRAERDHLVAQMIRSLPVKLRDPFLLAASGEHRYAEIAALLGIPEGTVKWRVAEARRVLREKLTRVGVER